MYVIISLLPEFHRYAFPSLWDYVCQNPNAIDVYLGLGTLLAFI
jgi:hypothetical protein